MYSKHGGAAMARKNLLKGLMDSAEATQAAPAPVSATPRYKKGAIGAVSQSIADLKSRSVSEIDLSLIDMAGHVDRLEEEDADLDALVRSIREYGQQVPVLLRPNPDHPERFQVVYGRRRLRALRALGQPAKALIRDLDDQALLIAQGQENSARKDLTFIERANFARQMRDDGYDRKIIGDALHVDKTVISRMLSVADVIPVELIEAIGPAPSVGRDRWLALADLMAKTNTSVADALLRIERSVNSDERFKGLLSALSRSDAPAPKQKLRAAQVVTDADGNQIARASWSGKTMTLNISETTENGFDKWLLENLTRIHQDWKSTSDE